MLLPTKGIVLKLQKYSETSVISKIYTREAGLQSYIVPGVRSLKSKGKSAMLQPLSLLDMVVYYRPNKNLDRIKEMRFATVYQKLPFDVLKRSIGIFMTEVILQSIKEEGEKNEELFDFLFQSFADLDILDQEVSNFHLHFLLAMSLYLGFYPYGSYSDTDHFFDLQEGRFAAEQPNHPLYLSELDAEVLNTLIQKQRNQDLSGFSNPERKMLLTQLVRYCRLHINGFGELNSPGILTTLLQ